MEIKDTKRKRFELYKAKGLYKYIKPYNGKFLTGLIFLGLSSATTLMFPALMGKLLDGDNGSSELSNGINLENINHVALILVAVFITQAVFSFLRVLLFAKVTESTLADIRKATYANVIRLPMSFYSKTRVGELNSRIAADTALLQDTLMITLPEFVRGILTVIIGIALISLYSYKLTLVILATIPVIVLFAIPFGKFIKSLSKKTQSKVAESNIITEETFTGIQSVKSYHNEWLESDRYSKAVEEIKKLGLKTATWRGGFISTMIVLGFCAIVLFVWYAAHLKNNGEISTGDLSAFILYSVFVGASLGGLATTYSKIQQAIGASENLLDLINESPENFSPKHDSHKITSGKVKFNKVKFSYPSRPEITVLNEISFEIDAGKQIALVGSSGSGKSTITALIQRFYDCENGSICIDDVDIKNYSLSELRGNMALVPQEVLLFGGSIRENIAYGKPEATEDEIIEAAQKANALEFISNFPEKFDTIVGERGIQLSGGQRQRIAIARAVLKNPKILILDEATSALDSESEKLVQDALEKLMKGRTTFVIAHRLSTIKNADTILVLDKGTITEKGSHQELMKLDDGLYLKLNTMQSLLS
ncbi:MAG: ABC transporter ATP-binding protein [Flavobacteriales bacterium]